MTNEQQSFLVDSMTLADAKKLVKYICKRSSNYNTLKKVHEHMGVRHSKDGTTTFIIDKVNCVVHIGRSVIPKVDGKRADHLNRPKGRMISAGRANLAFNIFNESTHIREAMKYRMEKGLPALNYSIKAENEDHLQKIIKDIIEG